LNLYDIAALRGSIDILSAVHLG